MVARRDLTDSESMLQTERNVDRNREIDRDRGMTRTVQTEPQPNAWMTVSAGSIVPLGLAGAALAATSMTKSEQVAVTAWIAVAIVGTASVISAAAIAHRRNVSFSRHNSNQKDVDLHRDMSR